MPMVSNTVVWRLGRKVQAVYDGSTEHMPVAPMAARIAKAKPFRSHCCMHVLSC